MDIATALKSEAHALEGYRKLVTIVRKAEKLVVLLKKHGLAKAGFNPDQSRDEHGRWTDDGAGGARSFIQDAAYQGDFHDAVKEQWANYLSGLGAVVETEIRLSVGEVTARIDILYQFPGSPLLGMEIKTGENPTYTLEQAIVYPHAMMGAGVTSPDAKIIRFRLAPGTLLPPIPILLIRASKPGEAYRFFKLTPEELKKSLPSLRQELSQLSGGEPSGFLRCRS